MPSSRAMIAAWQVRPPRLLTLAAARFITGSQSGSVMSAISTSPGFTRSISLAERIIRARPCPSFWPRLQNVELAVDSVAGPLDIHRTLVVAFDRDRVAGELLGFGIADGKARALVERYAFRCRGASRGCVLGEHHLGRLLARGLAQDRRPARSDIRLVNIELVGVDRSLHHGFAQPIVGGDEYDLVEAGLSVEREHDTGGAEVTAHHALHCRRERNPRVGEPLVHAIGDGAVVVEGCEDLFYRVNNVFYAIGILECFLL